MAKLKRGLLYLSLHNQLKKKVGLNGILKRKEFFCKIGKHGQVPDNLKHVVLKEMEDKKLIKKLDRDNLMVLSCDIDIETEVNKIYILAGLRDEDEEV